MQTPLWLKRWMDKNPTVQRIDRWMEKLSISVAREQLGKVVECLGKMSNKEDRQRIDDNALWDDAQNTMEKVCGGDCRRNTRQASRN
jgi:F0F1-type ATP synthase alpha subunit